MFYGQNGISWTWMNSYWRKTFYLSNLWKLILFFEANWQVMKEFTLEKIPSNVKDMTKLSRLQVNWKDMNESIQEKNHIKIKQTTLVSGIKKWLTLKKVIVLFGNALYFTRALLCSYLYFFADKTIAKLTLTPSIN